MTETVSTRAVGRTPTAVDAVVTHHRDGSRSGVARFNELLAGHLGVPLVGIDELPAEAAAAPLLSFKVRELDPAAESALRAWLDGVAATWDLFLHEYRGSELERTLVGGARLVHCGNTEIEAAVRDVARETDTLWTPGLVVDDRSFHAAETSVFSFGMAHKLRTDMFRRLRVLLDESARSYALYVSAANHETASLRDSTIVFEELDEIFLEKLYFLGNLSDVAVVNYLRSTTFYAAFFPAGVRANNTSVASALERGAVVITNLDEHSPREFVHLENVLDIEQLDELPSDPRVLARISAAALETGRSRSWEQLVEALR
ncbi:MAG: hypothetical protein WKF41_14320 [Gaiellaceae bacterium]